MRTRLTYALLFVLVLALAGTALAQNDADVVRLTILHTSDEHGWLQPYTPYGENITQGGAANVGGWWAEIEAYDPASTIILSGGDNWTGPSISTWFYGQPVVEVFNLLSYDASAIGNHEFDFGLDEMEARFAEAAYPYLSANIRDGATGDPASFAQPYALLERQGLTIAVIGLTSTRTPSVTHPQNVAGLGFMDYSSALDTYLPEVEAAGAEVVIILAHACTSEVSYLARAYN
ncbi:MAG: metallophosphatase, partial [Anaerolineae bacterium]|nr:metallophosphatase [Anaerolineae bacterium]